MIDIRIVNIRVKENEGLEKCQSNSRITIVTQAWEIPSFLANAAQVPIYGSLSIFLVP